MKILSLLVPLQPAVITRRDVSMGWVSPCCNIMPTRVAISELPGERSLTQTKTHNTVQEYKKSIDGARDVSERGRKSSAQGLAAGVLSPRLIL